MSESDRAPESREQQPGINRMPHNRIRTAPDKRMVLLHSDRAAPVSPQIYSRPDREADARRSHDEGDGIRRFRLRNKGIVQQAQTQAPVENQNESRDGQNRLEDP